MLPRSLLALVLVLLACPAWAQGYIRVTSCGSATPPLGASQGYMDASGNICTSGAGGGSSTVSINQTTPGTTNGVVVNSGAVSLSGTAAVQPAARTSVASSALAANLVVASAAANLYSFTVSADSTLYASDWFLMAYDATSAPADGAVTPKLCYQIASGTRSVTAAFPNPIAFTTGIVLGVSTTGCFTKTASTHASFMQGAY